MLKEAFSIIVVALALAFSNATSSQATTFFEQQDTGKSIANASKIIGDGIDKIQGSLSNPADIDLYQIEFDRDTKIEIDLYKLGFVVDANGNNRQNKSSFGSLYLFDSNGEALKSGLNSLNFAASAKQKLYLGISNGLNPLDRQGKILLDPNHQNISNGKLASWQKFASVIQVTTNYEISIAKENEVVSINEAAIILGVSLLMLSFFLDKQQNNH